MSNADPPALHGEFAYAHGAVHNVWFRPPDDWRIQSGDRVVEISTSEVTIRFTDDGAVAHGRILEDAGWHAKNFVHPRRLWFMHDELRTGRRHSVVPTGDVLATMAAGRRAWMIPITRTAHGPRGGYPVTALCIDDQFGMVLEARSEGATIGFRSLELGLDLADELFVWDGEIADDDRRQHYHNLDEASAAIGRPIPVPCYWPDGLSIILWIADPSTGGVQYDIDSAGRVGRLSMAPMGVEPPLLNAEDGAAIQEWQTETHVFRLKVFGDPFTDEELSRIIGSMR